MDEKQLAAAAIHFLRRAQLTGDEAPTLLAVMQWLGSKAGGVPPTVETPAIPEKTPRKKK